MTHHHHMMMMITMISFNICFFCLNSLFLLFSSEIYCYSNEFLFEFFCFSKTKCLHHQQQLRIIYVADQQPKTTNKMVRPFIFKSQKNRQMVSLNLLRMDLWIIIIMINKKKIIPHPVLVLVHLHFLIIIIILLKGKR